jgi:hypothetical protein
MVATVDIVVVKDLQGGIAPQLFADLKGSKGRLVWCKSSHRTPIALKYSNVGQRESWWQPRNRV